MERIRLQVEDRCSPLGDNPVRRQVTVSAGVATLTDRVQTLEELIEAADEAMYRAKRAGKNRVAGAAEEAA
jgi:diguanylate cyclase (GGDEF)-like protein